MSPLVSVLLTLQIGTFATPARSPSLPPLKVETRRLVAEAWRSPPSLALIVPTRHVAAPVSPGDGPVRTAPLHPVEWLSVFAQRLDLARSDVVHAATWLASSPVQLDVRPGHVSMRVTLHTR